MNLINDPKNQARYDLIHLVIDAPELVLCSVGQAAEGLQLMKEVIEAALRNAKARIGQRKEAIATRHKHVAHTRSLPCIGFEASLGIFVDVDAPSEMTCE